MAIFGSSDEKALDYQVLRDGGVSLYRNLKYLEEDLQWLQQRRYRIFRVDCTSWTSEANLHESLQSTFSFPGYYGRNRNALRDCMSDLEVPEDGGVVVSLLSSNVYATGPGSIRTSNAANGAEGILDTMLETSRYKLLTGRRFITLVQSDDPSIRFESLGAISVQWNRREWLNKDRGL